MYGVGLQLLSFDIPYQLDVTIHAFFRLHHCLPNAEANKAEAQKISIQPPIEYCDGFGFHVISTKRQAIALAAHEAKLHPYA